MMSRSRKFRLEALEGRQLPSGMGAAPPGEVSAFVKPDRKPQTMSIVGTIGGTYTPSSGRFDGSGNLTVLDDVQMLATIKSPSRPGTMTLTTDAGVLNFTVTRKINSPTIKATLKKGTGAYARWTGSGTVFVFVIQIGYSRSFTDTNTFNLKLKG
jgi:hypothetical protein